MPTRNEKLHSYLGIQNLIKELFNRMDKVETATKNIPISSESGIVSLTGDFVNNTDPTNPVLDRGYKVYSALMSQTGTDAPTVIVLENTLGAPIIWSYTGVGNYEGTLVGAFTTNKTFAFGGRPNYSDAFINVNVIPEDTINILSTVNIAAVVNTNGLMENTPVEIRVYN